MRSPSLDFANKSEVRGVRTYWRLETKPAM